MGQLADNHVVAHMGEHRGQTMEETNGPVGGDAATKLGVSVDPNFLLKHQEVQHQA